MSDQPDEPYLPEVAEEEGEGDGGGPVKSFLEHLEDLRWVLIKSLVAMGVGMLVCLLAVSYLVAALKWPLAQAGKLLNFHEQHIEIYWGTNRVYSFYTRTNVVNGIDFGHQNPAVWQIVTKLQGTNNLVLLNLRPAPPDLPGVDTANGPVDLIFLDPMAPFLSSLHMALFAGLLLAAPFICYFVGEFIVPALRIKERKYFLRAFGIGGGLFVLGVIFCYLVILPLALRAAQIYSHWMGIAMPQWRAEAYFTMTVKFMLGMGLGFELPVVLLALVKIGILDYQKLASMRRYMIVINLVLGAVLTTPEVVTQIFMALPLQILYECAVWIAWYWERKEKKRAAAGDATPS